MEYEHIEHPFDPVYDGRSKVIILGSLPSPASRQQNFYYGHPRNRFWPLITELLGEEFPNTADDKINMLLRHGIALWDSIYSCDIKGASDASIRNVVPTELRSIIEDSDITAVFCNGTASYRSYQKYQEKLTGITAVKLPSTSPANASVSLDELKNKWKIMLEYTL